MEDVMTYLKMLLDTYRKDGLLALAITDRDGVHLAKVTDDESHELALRQGFLSSFGMATDQASKLGIGQNKAMVCIYSTNQIIIFNKMPLVITLIGTVNANTGLLLGIEEELNTLVSCLSSVVDLLITEDEAGPQNV